jgi:hypothetical protein
MQSESGGLSKVGSANPVSQDRPVQHRHRDRLGATVQQRTPGKPTSVQQVSRRSSGMNLARTARAAAH